MKSVILAGGFGTRLRPLTFTLPKPMVPVLGRPMIGHVVAAVRKAGITDCVSLLYYEPEIIRNHFGDGSGFGVSMDYVLSRADWGTAGAVKNAARQIDDTVLVISGDVLTDFDLKKAIQFHKERSAAVTIVLTRVEKPLAFGIVIIDPETGKIERFLEKPAWGQVFSDTINTGIYVIEPHVLDYIPANEDFDFSKNLFPLLMQKGEPLFGYIADGYWRDVGNLREYRRANEDALRGVIELDIPGKLKKTKNANVYIGEKVEIEKAAEFEGIVLLGDGSKIGAGARLANSVVGENCIVGPSAEIDGSVLWNNVKIGPASCIEHAVVANDVTLGEGVTIGDHAVISENCEIGDHARVSAAIKIWPRKKVPPNSSITETLVWGDRTGGELFAGSRTSGIINSEISPEFAGKLGAAFGASLKGKGTVLVSRDGDRASQITARALFCGIMSAGVNIEDLGITPIPVIRWILSKNPRVGGVHVRKSPRHLDEQDMIFFDGDGTDLTTGQTRSIERLFDREDFPRADYKSLGMLEHPTDSMADYRRAAIEKIDCEIIKKAGFKVVVDYSHGGTAEVLPEVFSDLGVEPVNINAVVDPNRITRTREQRELDHERLAIIVRSLGADAGFMIDPSGERLHIVDENGRLLDDDAELCLVTDLVIRTLSPKTIGVPISATMGVNRLTREANVGLRYTRNDHLSMMGAARSGEVDFVGGTRGGFIFPYWLFASDAMFATLKILEMTATAGVKLSELTDNIPDYVRGQREVRCSYNLMGTVMRRLIEETADRPRDIIDGVRVYFQDSWVLIIPDAEHPIFHLIAEAQNEERLDKVLDEYEELLLRWRKQA
ncbi:nucleotidyltransferase [bacterium]|nr:MAG: nucleotidyltransferase [bacterium]